jgi:hypothetical protein
VNTGEGDGALLQSGIENDSLRGPPARRVASTTDR